MGGVKLIIFLVYIMLGLYFVNSAFGVVTLPRFVDIIDKWILLIGGILILLGGINYLRAGKKSQGLIFK